VDQDEINNICKMSNDCLIDKFLDADGMIETNLARARDAEARFEKNKKMRSVGTAGWTDDAC
jgi:hypothetical protein